MPGNAASPRCTPPYSTQAFAASDIHVPYTNLSVACFSQPNPAEGFWTFCSFLLSLEILSLDGLAGLGQLCHEFAKQ